MSDLISRINRENFLVFNRIDQVTPAFFGDMRDTVKLKRRNIRKEQSNRLVYLLQ